MHIRMYILFMISGISSCHGGNAEVTRSIDDGIRPTGHRRSADVDNNNNDIFLDFFSAVCLFCVRLCLCSSRQVNVRLPLNRSVISVIKVCNLQ